MNESVFALGGKHVLISGGGSGLGYGMAKEFLLAGARVTIIGRRAEVLVKAAEELYGEVNPVVCDITSSNSRIEGIAEAVRTFGPIDCLVNNAGIHLKCGLEEMSMDDFRMVVETHVTSAVGLTQLVVPEMRKRGQGTVIFIGSMTTIIGMPNVVAYSAAKSALGGVVRALAVELGSVGIRVNCILPGWIESPMLHKALDGDIERKNRILNRTPSKRFGKPADIGRAAVFLASEAAVFVNGALLPVDGGASIGF